MGIRRSRTFAIGVAGLTAALLIGSAVAVAGPGVKRGLVRGVHTEVSLIRADGSADAFVADRGQVTAQSPTSLTLARKDGINVTLGLTATTKIRGVVQVGKGAVVFSRGGVAFSVLAPRAPGALLGSGPGLGAMPRPGRPLFAVVHADVTEIRADKSTVSFSFDRGEVTAASSSSVTIKRADGPSVTKSISATTKIRGQLAVGGKAAIVSQGSAATRILALPPRP